MTPTAPPEGIFLKDLYDPRRRISREYFGVFAILLAVMPIIIFFGVPTVLHFFAARRGPNRGLVFGSRPIDLAPEVYPYAFALYAYVVVVVCINRMRATGRSLAWLLVPGYNVYLLLRAPDR
ncbi:hypothetical protein CLV84_1338 [Neolewinella xylanilytica]|uniref:Uncharacterized protein n=1 Tax=Neolewinella xylanilytica TaxID=1514080 RepID=A0A2S6IA44_9BACT|nr:hypothetical protein [Neolewinella xylanilytica]PPK88371.1 hypothetical protein CLV84_1338 [Neolewinella xylanilytica]